MDVPNQNLQDVAGQEVTIGDDDLKCSICHDYFFEPISTPCGHHFCRNCLIEWIRVQRTVATCPQCRDIFPLAFDKTYLNHTKPDMFLSAILKNTVYVRCSRNCMTLLHPSKCRSHDEECPNYPVCCPNHIRGCNMVAPRKDIREHIPSCDHHSCSAQVIGCDICGSMPMIAHHEKNCCFKKIKAYIDQSHIKPETNPHEVPDRQIPMLSGAAIFEGDRPRDSANIFSLFDSNSFNPADWVSTRSAAVGQPTSAGQPSPHNMTGSVRPVIRRQTDHSIINVNLRDLESLANTLASAVNNTGV